MLDHARKKRLCMTPFCTTCGAIPFMKWVGYTLGIKEPFPWRDLFRIPEYRELLIDQLAALNAEQAELHFDALKFFLTRAFLENSPKIQTDIQNKLGSTPAGHVLARMKKHYEERLAISALSDPELAKTRREEKKKFRAENHRKRIEFYRTNPFVSMLEPKVNDND